MHTLFQSLLLAGAGAVGTLLRAGCNTLAGRLIGTAFPWGTLAVNLVGSFAFGAIVALARARALSTEQEVVLLVGLLGGFTTYSSFAFQTTEMLATGRFATAVAYMIGTNALGLAAVWAGLRAFR
ncbi:MAG: fluoride efflux transporter FluC [Pirellulales bacterium]